MIKLNLKLPNNYYENSYYINIVAIVNINIIIL